MLILFIIAVLSTAVVAQDEATLRAPDFCLPIARAADEDNIAQRLNSGQLSPTPPAAPNSFTAVRRCHQGPIKKIHTVHNEFHWPPITRGSCDNLYCKDPPCIARKKVWCTKCVLVFKKVYGYWIKIGYRTRRYLDHLKCGCKKCSDIRNHLQCIRTKPCPNSYHPATFCYWIPFFFPIDRVPVQSDAIAPIPTIYPPTRGRCACCKPVPCKPPKFFNRATCKCQCRVRRCPPGEIFNTKTCKCDCPPNSVRNSDGKCVGICEKISLLYCKHITCRENPTLLCKVNAYNRCECPSCDDVGKNPLQCRKTKCLEQPSKPHCVTDPYSRKCRCPRCEDQTERAWCLKTYCGPYNNLQCKWKYPWQKCVCPH